MIFEKFCFWGHHKKDRKTAVVAAGAGPLIYIVIYWIAAPLCLTISRNVTSVSPFPEEPVAVGNLICTRIYWETLLIRRDLHNLLIKHPIQHHKCMHANNYSIITR